jgi:hypothetical protein
LPSGFGKSPIFGDVFFLADQVREVAVTKGAVVALAALPFLFACSKLVHKLKLFYVVCAWIAIRMGKFLVYEIFARKFCISAIYVQKIIRYAIFFQKRLFNPTLELW